MTQFIIIEWKWAETITSDALSGGKQASGGKALLGVLLQSQYVVREGRLHSAHS